MKKKLVALLTSALLVGSLSGCGLLGEKVTAESLIENAFGKEKIEAMDVDVALNLDADVDLSELMDSEDGVQGGTLGIKVGLDANMVTNKEYAHMVGNVKLDATIAKMEQKMERYYDYDNELQYDWDADTETWTYSDMDDEQEFDFQMELKPDMFSELTLDKHKKGEDYVVNATLDMDKLRDMFDEDFDLEDYTESVDMDDITITAKLAFAEDTKMIKSFSVNLGLDEMDGVELNEFSLEVTFNQIGGEVDVKIPKKVKKDAIEAVDWGFSSTPELDYNIDTSDVIDDTPNTEIPVDEKNVSVPDTTPVVSVEGDVLGSYDGKVFTGATPLSLFTDDGWYMDYDVDGIFVALINDKYDDSDLYLYGLKDKISLDDLKETGVYGYECDVAFNESGVYPKMTFGGLTWGATKEDVVSVYGEPSYNYNHDDYETLTYEANDGTEMTFTIYSKNDYGPVGLAAVSVVNYDLMD